MRTLFAKILLWFLATTVITITAVVVTSALTYNTERQPPFGMLMRLQMREAEHAYETGGKPELSETVQRLRSVMQGEMILADSSGRDLLSGEDRTDLIREAKRRRDWGFTLPFTRRSNVVWGRQSPDNRYWFFVIAPGRRSMFWFIQPHHLWILGI